MKSNKLKNLILSALAEDIGPGDVTSKAVVRQGKMATAKITAKEKGVIAGLPFAALVFKAADKKLKVRAKVKDGTKVGKGKLIAIVTGPARSILAAERTALNFLQRMSGIATLTRQYVDKVKGYEVEILDTRKTAPGLRMLDKYAVKVGGGTNHRMGLYDAVLIKENHVKMAGGIKKAVSLARKNSPPSMMIEVEAKSLREVAEAVDAGASNILLDNMNIFNLLRAVRMVKRYNKGAGIPSAAIRTEASGGVNLRNVKRIASAGVDSISVGALTHSTKALDISLQIA